MTAPFPLARSFFAFLLIALILNLGLISPFFLTLFLGWMLCEILRKFHDSMLRRKIRNWVASLIATIAATIVIVAPISIFAVTTVRKGGRWLVSLAQDPQLVEVWTTKAYRLPMAARFFDSSEEFKEWAMAHAQDLAKYVPGILSNVVGSVPDLLAQLALALIACYFFLCDGERFAKWIAPRIPIEESIRARLVKVAKQMVVQSALATLAAALVQALVILIAFLVLKLPVAAIAFGTAFILAWLPIVGVTPVWAIAMIVLFAQGESGKAVAMLAFGLASGVADNVVRPWVLKGGSDLHPLVSLIVIFGHIYFFGILGVFTGPVFAAILIEALEVWPEVAKDIGVYGGPSRVKVGPSEKAR